MIFWILSTGTTNQQKSFLVVLRIINENKSYYRDYDVTNENLYLVSSYLHQDARNELFSIRKFWTLVQKIRKNDFTYIRVFYMKAEVILLTMC